MMGAFETIIQEMLDMGVFRVLFPWLLTLAVSYGALDKMEYFEDDAVNGAIAVSMAFLAAAGMFLFVPQGLFANFMAVIAFLAIGVLGIVIVGAVGGIDFTELGEGEDESNPIRGIAMGAVPIALVLVFLYQVDLSGLIPNTSSNVWEDAVVPIGTLIFILLLVLFTAGGDDGEGEE